MPAAHMTDHWWSGIAGQAPEPAQILPVHQNQWSGVQCLTWTFSKLQATENFEKKMKFVRKGSK